MPAILPSISIYNWFPVFFLPLKSITSFPPGVNLVERYSLTTIRLSTLFTPLVALAMLSALNRPHEIKLHVRGAVPNIDAATFQRCCATVKDNCTLSLALKNNIRIDLETKLG